LHALDRGVASVGNVQNFGQQPIRTAAPNQMAAGPVAPPAAPGQAAPVDGAAPGATLVGTDPRITAAIGIYSHGLTSSQPVDVSMAIAQLEALGPAYREAAGRAVMAEMRPPLDPLKAQVLCAAVVRWDIKAATPLVAKLAQDSDPRVAIAGSDAYATLSGLRAASPLITGGAPTAPGAVPQPQAAAMVANGPLPPELIGLFQQMKDKKSAPLAAVQMAQLPPAQIALLANALVADGAIFQSSECPNLLAHILAKNAKNPIMMPALRQLANNTREKQIPSKDWDAARATAAVAIVSLGGPADLKDALHYLADPSTSYAMKGVVIDQLAKRPDLLNASPAVTTTLTVLMNSTLGHAPLAAAHALSLIHSPAARDALGESALLNGNVGSAFSNERFWALSWLESMGGPYSPGTYATLRAMAAEKTLAPFARDKATALLKKYGQH
jgi:hypothetical protein